MIAAPLLILAIAGCGPKAAPVADTTARVTSLGTENIAIVVQGQLQSGPMVSGALAPERQTTVRAEVGGPVLATSAERGQAVAKGELLARIDDAEIEVAWLSARSMHTAAENAAAVAKREEDRAVSLSAAGAIADRDLDQAKRANIAAQAQLADAKSRLVLAEKQRSATRITAPIAGVVSEKQVSAGDVVQPGNALFSIIDPRSMRLEAAVPAQELNQVRIGSAVHFSVSGYGERRFSGRVSRISPTADPATGQIQVFVSIPNAGNTLVSGLFAEGRIAAQTRTAMLVPVSAVNSTGLTPTLMRVKGGRVEKVDVKVGSRDSATETIEILTGVAQGDTVLLGTAQGLAPGTSVKVTAPGDAPPPLPPPAAGSGN